MTEVRRLLADEGILLRSRRPALEPAVKRLRAAGEIVAVLPGVYVPAEHALDARARAHAICLVDPNAVVVGAAAAWLSYWPEIGPPRAVGVAVRAARRPRTGYAFTRRSVPPELVRRCGRLRISAPALTALDLSTLEQSEPLDVALRARVVTVAQLSEALRLTAGRRGNGERWRLVVESHTNPWSFAERRGHRLLERHRITGWRANHPVRVESGAVYYPDIGFLRERVALEIDGRTHRAAPVFEADLRRQNELHAAGWIVLRCTLRQLEDEPQPVVDALEQVLASRRRADRQADRCAAVRRR